MRRIGALLVLLVLLSSCGDDRAVVTDAATPDATLDAPPPCEPVAPIDVTSVTSSPLAFAPTLAFDGSSYGLLWADAPSSGSCTIAGWKFARLDRSGAMLGNVLSLSAAPTLLTTGGLVWTGAEYLATLVADEGEGAGAYTYRIDDAATLIGTPALAVPGATTVATAWSGTYVGLAYANADTFFVTLDAAGTVTGTTKTVHASPSLVDVAWAADGWIVGFGGNFGPAYHARLQLDGTPLAAATEINDASGGSIGGPPSVEVAGTGSVMMWQDTPRPRPMQLTRFDHTGATLDTQSIAPPSWTMRSALARGTGEVGAIWKDDRTGTFEIYFARIDDSGTIVETDRRVTNGHAWLGCDSADAMTLVATDKGYAAAWAESDETTSTATIRFAHVCPLP